MNLPVQPDAADLLRRVAQKDRAAFEEFYDLMSPLAFTFALRLLRTRSDAEDLLQDIFLQIWNNAGNYDPKRGRPEAWVITITKSRAIDRLRSLRRRDGKQPELEQMTLDRTEQAVDQDKRDHEIRFSVESALDELTDVQRTALEMAYFEGMTQTEIADKLNVPLGTVKTRIRDGLKRLKDFFKTNAGDAA